jgi:hypothetical protein
MPIVIAGITQNRAHDPQSAGFCKEVKGEVLIRLTRGTASGSEHGFPYEPCSLPLAVLIQRSDELDKLFAVEIKSRRTPAENFLFFSNEASYPQNNHLKNPESRSRAMTSLTFTRALIFALIAGALLFQTPDQIRGPLPGKNAQYSFVPGTRGEQNIDRTTRARFEQTFGKLPIRFEANEGQTDMRVKFMARGVGYSVFLTGDETVLHLRKGKSGNERAEEQEKQTADRSDESAVLRMKLAGSNSSSRVSGAGKLPTTSNYFIGNNPATWRREVSNYSKVKYESVYPGIDMVWYGNQQLLEHDFLIAPGADPSRIKLSFSGTDKISIDSAGALVLRAGAEDLRLLKPHAWQESNAGRRTIPCDYRLDEKGQVEFRLGEYEATLPLVIDPALVYSTYIGGIGGDSALDIAVDGEGAAYVSGLTNSTDFPGPSPIQSTKGALTDAYVLKINPAGNAVVFGAWIGGSGSESAPAVSVDLSGNVYLAGVTTSTNFPLRNPLQTSITGPTDAFVLKIDSSGSTLLYSTYFGGTGADNASGLAVDGAGNVYLTGSTDSIDFPLTNAFQTVKNGSGAYASDNQGASWGEIGNGLNGADVNDLVISPGDSSTIFAGTDRGVFKSVDSGASWNLLGGTQFIRNISQVIVDPTTPEILYAVSPTQLFKSIDGGATWVQKPISLVLRLAINPATPSTLYAGTFNGIQISVNGGDSWTSIPINSDSCGPILQVEAIEVDPITPTTVYFGASCGVYKSINGGATWTFAGNGLPPIFGQRITRIAISPSNPATLFALVNNASMFKTTNSGGNWVQLNAPAIGAPQTSLLPLPLTVAPDNAEVVYAGSRGSGIFRSNDGGASWNPVNNGLEAIDIRAILIDPNSPERIYAGADSGTEAYVAKLDATASSIVYSSYLGGLASDSGLDIDVDSTGAAYVTGTTFSANFPVVNPFQATFGGLSDAFIARVDASGSTLSWATYLGGSNSDNAAGIAISSTGEIFIAGGTLSSDFPVMNAIQPLLKGLQEGFIARLKNDGSGLDFSTYLGGARSESIAAIAVDSAGAPYVTGSTNSLDFPVANAVQSTLAGAPAINATDAFVTKLSASGAAIIYSTYLGGTGTDQGVGIAVDASGNAYVTGNALSSNFPTTPSPIRSAGPSDAFVTKLGVSADLAITLSGAPNPVMVKKELTYSLIAANNGPDPADARVTVTLPQGAPLVSLASSIGSCSGESVINCDLGDLAPGSAARITIIVSPSSVGTIIAGANVTSGTSDINHANNTATLETNVSLSPSIYGRVTTEGGAGVSGVTIEVDGSGRPPAVTAGDGYYQVSELTKGESYRVTPSRQGYVFHPPSREINKLQSDRQADFRGVACSFSLSTTSLSFPATGGIGNVTLSSSDHQCAWTATSNAPWIRLTSAPAGNGSGPVKFEVEPTNASRGGTITIAGLRIKVFQEFNACESVSFNVTPRVNLPSDFYGEQILVKDFNQDSLLDLVAIRIAGQRGLSFFPSASDGGFGSPINVLNLPGVNPFVKDLTTGDLNGDGALDIVAISEDEIRADGSGSWSVWTILSNDAGGFASPMRYANSQNLKLASSGDFNSDGKTDLVVAISDDDKTTDALLFLNDGTGSFGQPQEIRRDETFTPHNHLKVASTDLDGDGKLDLALIHSFGAAIYKGDGAGGFTPRPGAGPGFFMTGAIGDFNGDGRPDLFAVEPGGGDDLIVFLNDGTGGFGARVRTPSQQEAFSAQGPIAEDFNGDGKTDVLIRAVSQTTFRETGIRLFTATAGGMFSEPISFHPSVAERAITTADFNHDGLPDIFSLNINGGLTTVSAQNGGFNAPRGFDYSPPGQLFPQFSVRDLKSGDLNGDGALDLVVAASGLSDAAIMFGDGNGAFNAPVSINSGVIGGAPGAVEIRDFNNNGSLDLALLNPNTRDLVILNNAGQGAFMPAARISVGVNATGFVSADFNNDGNLDIVVSGESIGLALYLGDGGLGFTQSATGIGGNITNVFFTSGDFNGDGKRDLAIFDDLQSQSGNGVNIVILLGDGQGGFGQPSNVRIQEPLIFLSAADLNLDGRDDLIYTHGFIGNALFVVLSNPEGGFGAPTPYQVGGVTGSVVSADINGDGKLDLISSSFDTGTISLLLGDGDGGFNPQMSLPVFDSPSLIATGDFDQDGRIDLAIPRIGVPLIAIIKNRSTCGP